MSIARKPVGDEGPHIAPYTGMEAYRDGLEPAHQQHNYSLPRHGPGSSQLSKHEQYTDGPPKQKRKKLCGIPILAFWLLLAFIIAPIAAIAVVGGLLGSSHILIQANSNCNNKRSINDRYNHRHAIYNRRVRMHKEWYRFHLHNWRYLHDTLRDLGMEKAWNNTSTDLAVANVDSYGSCIDACALSRQEGIRWTGAFKSCMTVV